MELEPNETGSADKVNAKTVKDLENELERIRAKYAGFDNLQARAQAGDEKAREASQYAAYLKERLDSLRHEASAAIETATSGMDLS